MTTIVSEEPSMKLEAGSTSTSVLAHVTNLQTKAAGAYDNKGTKRHDN